MNSRFFALLKVNFLGLLGINKMAKSKNGHKKKWLVYALVVGTGLLLSLIFGFYMNNAIKLFASEEKLTIINMAILGYVCFTVCYFTFSAKNNLFGCKDYDLLFSMPLDKKTIIGVKALSLYIFAFVVGLMVFVPAYIVLLINNITPNAVFTIRYFVMLVFLPAVPLSFAIVLGAFISIISSRFKHKNLAEIIATILLLAICFGVGFMSSSKMSKMTSFLQNIFFCKYFMQSLTNVVTMIIVILISVVAFIVMFLFVNMVFFDVNAKLKTTSTKKKIEKGEKKPLFYEFNGKYFALFKKEYKTLFKCPAYLINTMLGIPLSILLLVILGIVFNNANIVNTLKPYIIVYGPLIITFCLNMSPMTTSSLSMEGKGFQMLRSMPIDMTKLLLVKLIANYFAYVCSAIVIGIATALTFSLAFFDALMFIICMIALIFFDGAICLYFNLLRPTFTWNNPQEIVKQSMPVFLGVVTSFISTGVALVVLIFTSRVSSIFALILCSLLFFALAFIFIYIIVEKGEHLINKNC